MSAIVEERAEHYGDPVPNHARIAKLWSAFIGHEITAHDVAWMMVLLKASRSKVDPKHQDNYLDANGYIHIARDIST